MQVSGNKLIDTSSIASKAYVSNSDCSSSESGASSNDVPFFRGSAITVVPCSNKHLDLAIRELQLHFKEKFDGDALTMKAVERVCEAVNKKVMSRVRLNKIKLELKLDLNYEGSWGIYHERIVNLAGKFDKLIKWNSQQLWEKFESVLENNVGDKFEALKKEFHSGEFHSEESHGQFDSMLKLVTSALLVGVDCKAFLNSLCLGGLKNLVKEFVLVEVPSSEGTSRVRKELRSRSNSLPQRRPMVSPCSEQPENKTTLETGKAKSAENLKGNPIKLRQRQRQRQNEMIPALTPFQRSAQYQQVVVSNSTREKNTESSSVVSSAAPSEASNAWLQHASSVNQSNEQSPIFNNESKENWKKALEAFADDYDDKNKNTTQCFWAGLMPYLSDSFGKQTAFSLQSKVVNRLHFNELFKCDPVGRMRLLVEVAFDDRPKKNQEHTVGGEFTPVETISYTSLLEALFQAGHGDKIRERLHPVRDQHDQPDCGDANPFSRANTYKEPGIKLRKNEQNYPTRSASFGPKSRRPSLIQRLRSGFNFSKSKSTTQISTQD